MKKNKTALFFALAVFLPVLLLPVSSVEAFGGIVGRERYQVVTPELHENPSGSSEPAPQFLPEPVPGQTGGETLQNSFMPVERTSRRGGGVYVPSATPSLPYTPPPSSSANPPPSKQNPAIPEEEPSWLTADEAKACTLLNEFRIKNGLSPLRTDQNLTRVARLKAQDIINNNYFAHLSPTYGTIGQMLRGQGITFTIAGENLSKSGNVAQAHLQLEYSTQGHRENMLNQGYNNVGIGILKLQKTPGIIMVQLFTD